jgi:hypothetical protein
VLSLLLLTSPALAVMPPSVYRTAAKNAAYHAQVKVLKVAVPKTTPGECGVKAKVVRVFRNKTGKLKVGRTIAFSIACKRKGDSIPVGGTIWQSAEALAKAKFLEVALDGDKTGKTFKVALYNISIIKAASKKPQYGFPFHQPPGK